MKITTTVKCEVEDEGTAIREFICHIPRSGNYNPLPEFNKLLDKIAQKAFEAGILFAKQYHTPSLEGEHLENITQNKK